MSPFEIQGLWCLPEHAPSARGILLGLRQRRIAEVVGELRPVVVVDNVLPSGQVQKYRDHSRDDNGSYPVVWGEAEHKSYTLLNALQTSKRDWSPEQSTETVHANAVLEGACFDCPDLETDRVLFRVGDLADWVDVTGLDVTYPRMDRAGEEFAVVAARYVPELTIPSAGPKVSLRHQLGVTTTGSEALGIEQDWVLRIDQDQVAPLQTFVGSPVTSMTW